MLRSNSAVAAEELRRGEERPTIDRGGLPLPLGLLPVLPRWGEAGPSGGVATPLRAGALELAALQLLTEPLAIAAAATATPLPQLPNPATRLPALLPGTMSLAPLTLPKLPAPPPSPEALPPATGTPAGVAAGTAAAPPPLPLPPAALLPEGRRCGGLEDEEPRRGDTPITA